MQMMEDFHKGELNLSRISYGIIVLLPKIKEVANIRQYRPICLLNVFYKLFTKVLAIRLMGVAQDIISETQTTFIKERYILEGVLVLHEVKCRRQRRIILKLEFEKVYDKVIWEFLKDVMVKKGFQDKWIQWVM
jgi:hypothetical protein